MIPALKPGMCAFSHAIVQTSPAVFVGWYAIVQYTLFYTCFCSFQFPLDHSSKADCTLSIEQKKVLSSLYLVWRQVFVSFVRLLYGHAVYHVNSSGIKKVTVLTVVPNLL